MNSKPNLQTFLAAEEAVETQCAETGFLRLPLSAIKVDPAIQQRANGTNEEVIEEYAQAMRDGAKFPPLVVFGDDGANYHLADGFHRVAAYRLAHPDARDIDCEVHSGGRDDALFFASGANASHGLPRSKADKRKSVLLLLGSEQWSRLSDREIARHCKVSHPFVARVRDEQLETFPDIGRKEADQAVGIHAAADVGSANTPAVTANRRRTAKRGSKPHTKKTGRTGSGRAAPGQNKPEPFLTAFGWSMATEFERVNFVNGIGALDLLNMVWKATRQDERQEFAKEHHAEIDALANAPGLTVAAEPSANLMPTEPRSVGV
jgi:hypothetical protein